MGKRYRMFGVLGVLCVILCWPGVAFANAGTPLMWMGIVRLVFINILIGIGEGVFLFLVFWCYKKGDFSLLKAIGIMILANYFSMIVGEYAILPFVKEHLITSLGEVPLYGAWDFLKAMLVAVIALTVLLEWPFCYWVLRKKKHAFWKSLIASPMVHVGSYAVLISIYFSVSGLGVYTELEIDKSMSFVKNPEAWVYYISVDDGDVYRIHPDGSGNEIVFDSDYERTYGWLYSSPTLFAWELDKGEGRIDLWCADEDKSKRLKKNFASQAGAANMMVEGYYSGGQWPEEISSRMFGDYLPAIYLGDGEESEWTVKQGYMALWGIDFIRKDGKEKFRVNLETPFLRWNTRSATILPGDQVVFQLGEQIVLVDLNERKIGFIAMGQGPVVALD